VTDTAEVYAGQVAAGGPGDKVALSCAGLNEVLNGAHPRKVLTLCRDPVAGQIKTHSWRVGSMGVTSLASAAETKLLGIGVVHGMSVAQNNDVFATVASARGTTPSPLVSMVRTPPGVAVPEIASDTLANS